MEAEQIKPTLSKMPLQTISEDRWGTMSMPHRGGEVGAKQCCVLEYLLLGNR